jgi:hypothetical protein
MHSDFRIGGIEDVQGVDTRQRKYCHNMTNMALILKQHSNRDNDTVRYL